MTCSSQHLTLVIDSTKLEQVDNPSVSERKKPGSILETSTTQNDTIFLTDYQESIGKYHGGQAHQEWWNVEKANIEDDYENDKDNDIIATQDDDDIDMIDTYENQF